MRLLALALFGITTTALGAAAPESVYAPLRLYAGTWHVTRKDQPAGAKPDELKNDCALVGNFYVCQQTVNGTPESLIIFVPATQPGHYYNQSVRQDGRATGRGDLEISGERWVYSSTWDAGGKTIHYHTINVFTGKNHIHFEQQESSNEKDWKTTNSGDEERVSGLRR